MAESPAQVNVTSPERRLWATGAADELAAVSEALRAAKDVLRDLTDPATDPRILEKLYRDFHQQTSLVAHHAIEARNRSHGL